MHSNIWATLYWALVPSVLFLLIGLILRLSQKTFAKLFQFIGAGLLLFPIIFKLTHFASEKEEMKLRVGTYVVVRQENPDDLCKGTRFDIVSEMDF